MSDGTKDGIAATVMVLVVITFIIGVIAGMFWVIPQWNVYRSELSGKAQLVKAEENRQITIIEAETEKEAAVLKAETDVIRAGGIAEANEIIGDSITDAYISWRWVESLHGEGQQTIYIPTEANLPILEATRNGR